MILVTCDEIPGRRIRRVKGLVRGSAVRARSLPRDIMALLRMLVGGEIPEYTKAMAETREQALDRMTEQAQELGADAVVAIRFVSTELMGGAAELTVYGTAVELEPGR